MSDYCAGTTKAYLEIVIGSSTIQILSDAPPLKITEADESSAGTGRVSWTAWYMSHYSGTAARNNCTKRSRSLSGVTDLRPGPLSIWFSGGLLYFSSGAGTILLSNKGQSYHGCPPQYFYQVSQSITWVTPPVQKWAITVTNARNEVEYTSGWQTNKPYVSRAICGCLPGLEYCGDFPLSFCCWDPTEVLNQVQRLRSNFPLMEAKVKSLPCYVPPKE